MEKFWFLKEVVTVLLMEMGWFFEDLVPHLEFLMPTETLAQNLDSSYG